MKGFTLSRFSALVAGFVVLMSFSLSAKASSEGGKEKFNAGEMILHHVQDAHEIHFFTTPSGHHYSLHLPIILYTDKGFDVFSSARFMDENHDPAAYTSEKTGYTFSLEHEHISIVTPNDHNHEEMHTEKVVDSMMNDSMVSDSAEVMAVELVSESHEGEHHAEGPAVYDLSITKTVAGMFLTMIILFWLFFTAAKGYKTNKGKAPKGIQSFLEPLIIFVRDEVAKPSIGKHYEKFTPFLLSVFFFIWVGNILGLIPFLGGLNITGNIAVTLVLALFAFGVTTINGNANYWKHIFATPGVPVWLLPIMVPIELLGMINKPVVLMLRLFANITAGHIIILSFVSLIFIFGETSVGTGYGVSVGSVVFLVFMTCLEVLVAFLQAYVFTLLSALYFGMATEEHH
jgi:F-type H+-transporting ATPase subunit a